MKNELKEFNDFLESIDLDKYRDKYKSIKTMEADMSKDIQALNSIYKTYWDRNNLKIDKFLSFDDYYHKYYLSYEMLKKVIEFNNNKIGLCNECLMKGIEARIYRTWASLITQIQAGYCCAEVFGKRNVEQSVDLDHLGIDIKVTYKNIKIGIQIKKRNRKKRNSKQKTSTKRTKRSIKTL